MNFLSVGSVDVRRSVAVGDSPINGQWVVEDVVVRDKEYRRLVFLASRNLVQSEAPLKGSFSILLIFDIVFVISFDRVAPFKIGQRSTRD